MSILYCMAADAEYGPHLRARITPLITGVGPVEAAISVAGALASASASGNLPGLVVTLGSAGSRHLEQAGIYQAGAVSYRDMDARPLGFPRGVTPFLDRPAVIDIPHRIDGIPAATLSTGADVVSGAAYEAIEADMVDMESYAILRACENFGLPLVILRGISDGAAELARIEDWTRYLDVIDEKLARSVDQVEAQYAAGRF